MPHRNGLFGVSLLAAVVLAATCPPRPANADAKSIYDVIDRIPQGIFDGNPRAWNGVVVPGADIVDDLTPPFRFDPPAAFVPGAAPSAAPYPWTGGPRTALTRLGRPIQSEQAGNAAYEVVRVRYATEKGGVKQSGTADEVFVMTADEATVPFLDSTKSIAMFASLQESDSNPHATPADPAMLAPIDALMTATLADSPPNAKARAAIAAAYIAEPLIVDDFPPYRFSGTAAVAAWTSGFEAIFAHAKIAHLHMHLATAEFVGTSGTRATLVIPMHVAFTSNGKPSAVDGRWLFVLDDAGGLYRIVASVWAVTKHS